VRLLVELCRHKKDLSVKKIVKIPTVAFQFFLVLNIQQVRSAGELLF
jgi:hypothetical protein